MSYRFVLWMAGLVVITVLIELCAFLFGTADFDPDEDHQGN